MAERSKTVALATPAPVPNTGSSNEGCAPDGDLALKGTKPAEHGRAVTPLRKLAAKMYNYPGLGPRVIPHNRVIVQHNLDARWAEELQCEQSKK